MSASRETERGATALTVEKRRALDAQVAERVMGWTEVTAYPSTLNMLGYLGRDPDGNVRDVPWFSRDMGAAWLVVESRPLGVWNWNVSQTDSGEWFAEVRLGYQTSYDKAFPVWAATAPLAICRAALSALSSAPAGRTPE